MTKLVDTELGVAPTDHQLQQLISAEKGYPKSGIPRTWLRPDADVPVLVVDETGIKLTRDDGTSAPAPPIVVGSPAGGDLTGTYPNPALAGASVDALVPPGTIWAYAGASAPAGWLPCNGADLSRTTYARLFAAIGTTYGAADGGTFKVPNLVGRVLVGVSGAHPRGQIGGAESVVGPPHTHPGDHHHGLGGHTHGLGGHTHGLNGHTHGVDVGHDHLVAHPTATSPVNVLSLSDTHQTAAVGFKAVGLDHWHAFDVPAKVATAESLGPTSPVTDTAAPVTITATTGPGPIVDTADTDSHPAASYPASVPTMMPFGVVLYIIRAGA